MRAGGAPRETREGEQGVRRGEKVHDFSHEGIVVQFRPARCIHAADCVRGLPQVFRPGDRPWVHPERAGADQTAEVVERCPTGALTYTRLDGGPEEVPSARNTALISPDGPIYLRGHIEVVTPEGEPIVIAHRLALCRCGASARKPLCDNSHRRTRFRDPGTLLKVDPPRTDLDQRLQVVVSERGPFQLRGPVTIVSGSGEVRTEGDRRSLCRCGASREKPFCDGSHNTIGFTG
jgi:CDGSH-type Zn-finger protein/uncharacterized Fe-S cluster protein YjdI